MALLIADRMYDHVCEILPEHLIGLEVRAVLLDLDSTLMGAREHEMPEQVIRWVTSLKEQGLRVMMLSNNKHESRVKQMCSLLEIPYFYRAKKPFRSGFQKAADALGLLPRQIAMVGDQIYTDVLGANCFGAHSFLVESLDMHLGYVKLRRIVEWPFVAFARNYRKV